MALTNTRAQHAQVSNFGAQAAFVVPLLYGVTRASAHGYLAGSLDLMETSLSAHAAAWSAPAPLLARLCMLVPLGPLALRIAVASTLALSAAALLAYRALDTLLLAQGVGVPALRAAVALGFCLFGVGVPGLFFQALRPEVFAVQTLLAVAFLERLTRLEASWPSHDLRALYTAAVCFGGLAAGDPVCALLLLTAALPTLSRVARAKGLRRLGACALGALAVGAGVRIGCGFTHTPWWPTLAAGGHTAATVFAYPRAYLSALGLFGVWAVLGAIAALQTPGVRRIGALWTGACVLPVLGYGLFGLSPHAPDGLGMLSFALVASTLLAAALCGALLAPDGHGKPQASRAQLTAVFALLALGALRLHVTATQSALTSFALPDALSGQIRQRLPARSLVLASDPRSAAFLLASEAEDQARPDLRLLAPSRWQSAGTHAQTLPMDAELRPLLRAYLLSGELEQAELESLAAKRPVVLDAQPQLSPDLFPALRLQHFMFEVLGAAASHAEKRNAAADFVAELGQLQDAAGSSLAEPVARPWLAAQTLSTALFLAATGEAESARAAIDFGRPLAAHASGWDALSAALSADPPAKALDVRPFLPRDPLSLE